MNIFDFHLHPGYDFHGPALEYHNFCEPLKQAGITKCAGSFININGKNRPIEEYATIIPEYNRLVWEFHDTDPDFFIPGIHIHPDFPEMSLPEIEMHHKKGGILIGEFVPYMMGWSFAHKNLLPLLATIRDLGMVVSIHPSRDFSPIEQIMSQLPDLKLVVAHLGGYDLYDKTLSLMKQYDTVYTDISAHSADFPGIIAEAVNRVGSERILYGSDYPGYKTTPFIESVLQAPIAYAEKENILYNNAARLLEIT